MARSPSRRVVERREAQKRYKEDVERTGKSFFPHAMFHDTVMSLVVVCVIVGLAVVWYYDADGTEAGFLGPHFTEEADPGTTDFIPRPDWYFYFLFYLLRIFKWPESVILGTVGIPTLALVLLLALPFVDVRRERRLMRRPVALVAAILVVISMGVLTYKGATAEEALGSELVEAVPEWAEIQGFEDDPVAIAGAELYAADRLLAVPCLPRRRLDQPRRARADRDRRERPRRRVLQGVRREPGRVRQQRDAAIRRGVRRQPERRAADADRHLPRRLPRPAGGSPRPVSSSGPMTTAESSRCGVLSRAHIANMDAPCVLASLALRPSSTRQ